jgi:hypothetical protein
MPSPSMRQCMEYEYPQHFRSFWVRSLLGPGNKAIMEAHRSWICLAHEKCSSVTRTLGGGNRKQNSHCGGFSRLKVAEPAMPGICSWVCHRDTCESMLTTALFTKSREPAEMPINVWIVSVVCIYNWVSFSYKNKIMYAGKWLGLKIIKIK